MRIRCYTYDLNIKKIYIWVYTYMYIWIYTCIGFMVVEISHSLKELINKAEVQINYKPEKDGFLCLVSLL